MTSLVGALAGLAKVAFKVSDKGARIGAKGFLKWYSKKTDRGVQLPPKYQGMPSFVTKDLQQYDSEQLKVLKHLAEFEKKGGWIRPTYVSRDTLQKWIEQLPHEHKLTSGYLETLIDAAKNKDSLNSIAAYLRSESANNLTKFVRAELIAQCFDKMRLIDIIHVLH